jgi:hypothetical protein
VSGHARPLARPVAALHGTTLALLTRVTEPGVTLRREAAHGIAADKLLTVIDQTMQPTAVPLWLRRRSGGWASGVRSRRVANASGAPVLGG